MFKTDKECKVDENCPSGKRISLLSSDLSIGCSFARRSNRSGKGDDSIMNSVLKKVHCEIFLLDIRFLP
jgi:hypothetical protein